MLHECLYAKCHLSLDFSTRSFFNFEFCTSATHAQDAQVFVVARKGLVQNLELKNVCVEKSQLRWHIPCQCCRYMLHVSSMLHFMRMFMHDASCSVSHVMLLASLYCPLLPLCRLDQQGKLLDTVYWFSFALDTRRTRHHACLHATCETCMQHVPSHAIHMQHTSNPLATHRHINERHTCNIQATQTEHACSVHVTAQGQLLGTCLFPS